MKLFNKYREVNKILILQTHIAYEFCINFTAYFSNNPTDIYMHH